MIMYHTAEISGNRFMSQSLLVHVAVMICTEQRTFWLSVHLVKLSGYPAALTIDSLALLTVPPTILSVAIIQYANKHCGLKLSTSC